MRPSNLHYAIVVMLLALVATACGATDEAVTTSSPPLLTTTSALPSTTEPTTTSLPTTTATTQPPATTATSTTLPPSTTTTEPPPTTTTLPGEPFEYGFPSNGDVLGAVGVAFDDVLNVREGPGTTYAIVESVAPLGTAIATGRARLLSRSIWWEITVDGTTGWSNSRYLSYLGETDDTTSRIVERFGSIPVAETMTELGQIVADLNASEDPPSIVVMVVAPTVGDLGEVTFDVVGLGDDSVWGVRLHVFGMPTESGEGFSLKSVETTALCARGLSGGVCV